MTTFFKKIRHPRIISCALLLGLSNVAMAKCSFMDDRFDANATVNFNIGDIVIQRDAPVGSVVATVSSNTLGMRNDFFKCPDINFSTLWEKGSGGFIPMVNGSEILYYSGIPGLSYRVITPGKGSTKNLYGTGALPRQISGKACVVTGTGWHYLCGGTWGEVKIELVKMFSTTGSGKLKLGAITHASVLGESGIMTFNINGGSVKTIACSVKNTSISVPMSKTKNTDFSGVNTTSGDASFKINLDCDAQANIHMTLNAGSAGASDAERGILALDNSGDADAASGVGVQVLYKNAPVELGEKMAIARSAANGAYDIPLQARYIQTAAKIKPGKADANATFTMTYQ